MVSYLSVEQVVCSARGRLPDREREMPALPPVTSLGCSPMSPAIGTQGNCTYIIMYVPVLQEGRTGMQNEDLQLRQRYGVQRDNQHVESSLDSTVRQTQDLDTDVLSTST